MVHFYAFFGKTLTPPDSLLNLCDSESLNMGSVPYYKVYTGADNIKALGGGRDLF